MRVSLEFKPEDLWVGVYWRRHSYWEQYDERIWTGRNRLDIWVCLVPCLPIHIEVQ